MFSRKPNNTDTELEDRSATSAKSRPTKSGTNNRSFSASGGWELSDQNDPISPNSYMISYAGVLVPRFKDHLLIGDLSHMVDGGMRNACISYGWVLRFIQVDPQYLHWVMSVSISDYPAKFMKLLRRYTSDKIMEDFPRIRSKNPSGDFWAPGYFVGPGEYPFPQHVIDVFITQVRRQQGYYSE